RLVPGRLRILLRLLRVRLLLLRVRLGLAGLAEGILRARRACGQQEHRRQDEAQLADVVDTVHGWLLSVPTTGVMAGACWRLRRPGTGGAFARGRTAPHRRPFSERIESMIDWWSRCACDSASG